MTIDQICIFFLYKKKKKTVCNWSIYNEKSTRVCVCMCVIKYDGAVCLFTSIGVLFPKLVYAGLVRKFPAADISVG